MFDRQRDIRADAGQRDRGVADADRFRRHDKEPAAGHRHHHVPDQLRHGERHVEPPKTHPWAEPEVARRLFELGRDGTQRLIERKRHIPGLAGEDRENGGVFGAQHAAGRQFHEEHHRHRNEAQDRDRLQNVEQRHQDTLGVFVLGRERRVGKRENQRKHHRDQHAQRGARRIFGQVTRVERWRLLLQFGQRFEQMTARLAEKHQQADDQQHRQDVPAGKQPGPAPDRDWDIHAHARCPAVTEQSKKAQPRPVEAACDRDHITPTLCHSNLFRLRRRFVPAWPRLYGTASRHASDESSARVLAIRSRQPFVTRVTSLARRARGPRFHSGCAQSKAESPARTSNSIRVSDFGINAPRVGEAGVSVDRVREGSARFVQSSLALRVCEAPRCGPCRNG